MEKIKAYLNKKIVIACHDAGGADAITSWLFYQKISKIKFIKVSMSLLFNIGNASLFSYKYLFP
jgi:hypothetical protein